MSENKEYVAQTLENGALYISEDALTDTIVSAVLEVEGVHSISNAISAKKGAGKGIRVAINTNDSISVDCYVVALYGFSVVEIAKNVQAAVASAIESTTNVKLSDVNVSISGISHPKNKK